MRAMGFTGSNESMLIAAKVIPSGDIMQESDKHCTLHVGVYLLCDLTGQ
jgi:hypothetical protein